MEGRRHGRREGDGRGKKGGEKREEVEGRGRQERAKEIEMASSEVMKWHGQRLTQK